MNTELIRICREIRDQCKTELNKCTMWFGTGFVTVCFECRDKIPQKYRDEYHEIFMAYHKMLEDQRKIEKEFISKYWELDQ